MGKIYIIDALRTPIGDFGGSLKNLNVADLGVFLIKKLCLKNSDLSPIISPVFKLGSKHWSKIGLPPQILTPKRRQ